MKEILENILAVAHMLTVVGGPFFVADLSEWEVLERKKQRIGKEWGKKKTQEVPPFPAEIVMNLSWRRRCGSQG